MKTPIYNLYSEKLANLNDQLCFFLFNREELNQRIANFTSSVNPLFTTDLFAKNPYAPKIHITFEKLPEFQVQNQTLNFGAYFSFTYEFVSGYIDDVISILSTVNGVTLTENEQKKEPEKRLKLIINRCGQGTPPNELFDTITYCRLRRNYFTHILKTLNNKFQNLVDNQGNVLNTFWASKNYS